MSICREQKVYTVCKLTFKKLLIAIVATLSFFSVLAEAATISISDDIEVYASLTNTVVNMNRVSELHVTNASSPLSGCTINLDSSDSWLFLENIIPSVAASTYLNQIKVNGSQANINSNVRVVQYANGAVIIPHSPGFQPLQIFNQENFSGTSMFLSQYTAYGTSSLGSMTSTFSSFILKRGYTATFAQNENGTGYSKNYVAQDCDLEIGVLPDKLKGQVKFIRIFPWRWVSKKGIAGNIGANLDIKWWYNWNLDQNSSLDKEYVPIRQNRWWPGLGQNWKTRGVSHLLGYNEPDHTDQANLAVGDAIWSWPDLLGTGLRVGSPAPTDGGRDSWLYPFMEQADAADLRVDFVAVHYYWCYNPSNPSGAANQMYNFLKSIHDRTKRPIWITEWNNGANWTEKDCSDPTYAQQAAAIGAMIDMLDSTPWVERYAIYNWVEDVRRVEWDDGSPTTAGEVYRDQVSSIGYLQEVPGSGKSANSVYKFDVSFRDSSGNGNHPLVYGAPKRLSGKLGNALALDGNDDYLVLPTNMGDSTDFTFSGWIYWNGGSQWQRIIDFGADTSNYMFITPSAYSSQLRFAITNSGYNSEQRLESGTFPVGQWVHLAVTLDGNIGRLYVNGSQVDVNTITINPDSLGAVKNYLGKSQFAADPLFDGMIDDVIFADHALTSNEIFTLANPPSFLQDYIVNLNGTELKGYIGNSLLNYAKNYTAFSKVSGPSWLNIASDGSLSGIPGNSSVGSNTFTVRVDNESGYYDTAQLQIDVDNIYSGTQGIEDLAGFVSQWLQSGCIGLPACNGASLDGDNSVTMSDLSILSQTWMEDDTLQLYLKFDETNGDIAQGSSLYQRSAQLINGPTWDAGYIDGGLSFDGEGDYVRVTGYRGIGNAQSRTISVWIKAETDLSNTETGIHTIVSWGKGDSNDLNKKVTFMLDPTGKLSLATYGARLYGGLDLEDGQWHHAALVMPEGSDNIKQIKLYVDGSEITTNASGLNAVIDTAFTEDVLVGAYDSDLEPGIQLPAGYFNGIIDELRIYSTGLSDIEIAELAELAPVGL